MKVLCVCQGGNSRSVAMAFVLKYYYGVDALACGWEKNSQATLRYLCNWADHVIIMQPTFREYVPKEAHDKVHVIDVGPDVWCNGIHPQLVKLVGRLAEDTGLVAKVRI